MNSNLMQVENYYNKTVDELIEENKKYVYYVIKKYYFQYINTLHYEDIIQCGIVGLYNAFVTLDLLKEKTLLKHMEWCIRNSIREYVRNMFGEENSYKRAINSKGIISLSSKVNRNEKDDYSLGTELSEFICKDNLYFNKSCNDIEYITQRVDLREAISSLSDSLQEVINLYLQEKTFTEIGKRQGTSVMTATNRFKKAINIIKKYISDNK